MDDNQKSAAAAEWSKNGGGKGLLLLERNGFFPWIGCTKMGWQTREDAKQTNKMLANGKIYLFGADIFVCRQSILTIHSSAADFCLSSIFCRPPIWIWWIGWNLSSAEELIL
jgi:hypothetical protein